jgi:hypothetical protein
VVAILLAAGFAAMAAVASVFRLFNFVRAPRSSAIADQPRSDPQRGAAGTD